MDLYYAIQKMNLRNIRRYYDYLRPMGNPQQRAFRRCITYDSADVAAIPGNIWGVHYSYNLSNFDWHLGSMDEVKNKIDLDLAEQGYVMCNDYDELNKYMVLLW